MARTPKKERFTCAFYVWYLGDRKGVFTADGRSNNPDLGRHSLGTRDRKEALENLRALDRKMAVQHGLADPALLKADQTAEFLPLKEGQTRFLNHVKRPLTLGGVTQKTAKRYESVLGKFVEFSETHRIHFWHQVNTQFVQKYAAWLEQEDYKGKTLLFEIGLIKQVIRWQISEGLLPGTIAIGIKLKKAQGERTYCYTRAQIAAMIKHCRDNQDLHWLEPVVVTLAHTGLRISELAALEWADVDLEAGTIKLTDNLRNSRLSERSQAKTTKSHYNRTLSIHPQLRAILHDLPQAKDGLVFHGPRGGKIKPDTVRNILIREVLTPLKDQFPKKGKERGFEDGRLHSFRHFFCSTAANQGVPERMMMDWLGHRDSEMIRTYYHSDLAESERQMKKLPHLGGDQERPEGESDPAGGSSN